MIEQVFSRFQILFQQRRFEEAEKTLAQGLESYPENSALLKCMAETKLQLDDPQSALSFVDTAMTLDPDDYDLWILKGRISMASGQYEQAVHLLEQAIGMEPEDPNAHALLASVQLQEKKYEQALASSDKALSLDGEHLLALNNRSRALLKLNRKEDSFQTIETALHDDPENAYTHANYGWLLLEKGERRKAMDHFREALRKEPDSEMAISGMAEAMKASNPLYRAFLAYAFWIGNLTKKYQWGVIIGIYLAFRGLRALAANNEGLQPVLYPLIGVLALMAFSTWIISPLGNLFLRLSPHGRFLLNPEERKASTLVGIALAISLLATAAFFLTMAVPWLLLVAFGLTMMLPLGSMYNPSRKRKLLIYYTLAMVLIGIGAVAMAFSTGVPVNLFSFIYIILFIAYQWIANFMMIQRA